MLTAGEAGREARGPWREFNIDANHTHIVTHNGSQTLQSDETQ